MKNYFKTSVLWKALLSNLSRKKIDTFIFSLTLAGQFKGREKNRSYTILLQDSFLEKTEFFKNSLNFMTDVRHHHKFSPSFLLCH